MKVQTFQILALYTTYSLLVFPRPLYRNTNAPQLRGTSAYSELEWLALISV